jgi:hypothetical protein
MRRMVHVIVVAVLALFMAGCNIDFGQADPYRTEWNKKAGRDLACHGGTVVKQGEPSVYDIDRAGPDEVFVVMRCVTNNRKESEYGQLEVFERGADPDLPPLKVIVYRDDLVKLLMEPSFRGNRVTIEGTHDGAPVICTASWNDKHQVLLGNLPDKSAPSACFPA